MKFVSKILLCLTLLGASHAFSQEDTATTYFLLSLDRLERYLPSLEDITEYAIENSATVRYRRELAKVSQYDLQLIKRDWLRSVNINGGYFIGNQLNTVTSTIGTSAQSTLYSDGFSMGAAVQIPILHQTINRNAKVKRQKAQMFADAELEIVENQRIAEKAIEVYYSLIEAHKIFRVQSKSLQESKITWISIQEQYKMGHLEYHDVYDAHSNVNKAELQVAFAKKNFMINFKKLELMIGRSLTPFLKSKWIRSK